MSKVEQINDEELGKVVRRFHAEPATHPCEHVHPEHSYLPGVPCILEHVDRYVAMQCACVGPLRKAISKYLEADG